MSVELLHIDCMEFMAGLPDKAFDLAIVDPPYGINAPNMQMGHGAKSRGGRISTAVALKKGRLNSGGGQLKDRILNTSSIDWDCAAPPQEYFNELMRVSKNQIIWGGNYFPLPPSRCFMIWNKVQPWENFSQAEFAWTSFDKPAGLLTLGVSGGAFNETKIHPTQKPARLYKWLMTRLAQPGDRILDTHLGSGSSAIAAHSMGFDFVGCEIDESYYLAALKRFKTMTAQTQLFK